MDSKKLGRFGEKIARDYLKEKGYKILARNFKRKWGEIDIVAKKRRNIVFIEVKTIHQKEGFYPEDQIDWRKKRQLIKMAQIYLQEFKISLNSPWQIDIIAIEVSLNSQRVKIKHYKNAIEDIY